MTAPSVDRSVSLVIPTLNAEPWLAPLLSAVFSQTPRPREVILVDSMSTDGTRAVAAAYSDVHVHPIQDFSHGRARNIGARAAIGDVVVLMTQDALPANDRWLPELLAPFDDPTVAAVYSRQVPREEANPMERFFLHDRFPDGPAVRREKRGAGVLGLRDVFFSNVSAAFRRDALCRYPFDEALIMSEDQQVSRDLLEAGYAVVYQPRSVVIHSHNYTLGMVFRRYFDSVYSLSLIFAGHDVATSVAMGRAYVAREARYLFKHNPLWLPYYALYTSAKAGASILAHMADRLPMWLLKRISLHSYHWR